MTFPIHSDKASQCFNCDSTDMRNHRDSGHAHGNGSRVATCGRCGMSTWYDRPATLTKGGSDGMHLSELHLHCAD